MSAAADDDAERRPRLSEWLDALDEGWRAYLHVLEIYLADHAGEATATILVTGRSTAAQDEAWTRLAQALGVEAAAVGEEVAIEALNLDGTVERVSDDGIMLRTRRPGPGVALAGVYPWDDAVVTTLHAYLYGGAAADDEPAWRAWMEERFPPAWSVSDAAVR